MQIQTITQNLKTEKIYERCEFIWALLKQYLEREKYNQIDYDEFITLFSAGMLPNLGQREFDYAQEALSHEKMLKQVQSRMSELKGKTWKAPDGAILPSEFISTSNVNKRMLRAYAKALDEVSGKWPYNILRYDVADSLLLNRYIRDNYIKFDICVRHKHSRVVSFYLETKNHA